MRRCKGEPVLQELARQTEKSVLRWFGHMERMEEDRFLKRILGSGVSGVRLRGRPRVGLMDSVKRVLDERGMSAEQGRMIMCDRSEWKALVNA